MTPESRLRHWVERPESNQLARRRPIRRQSSEMSTYYASWRRGRAPLAARASCASARWLFQGGRLWSHAARLKVRSHLSRVDWRGLVTILFFSIRHMVARLVRPDNNERMRSHTAVV